MGQQAIRKTDLGTIILHWMLVIALIVAVATGLRITSNDPAWAWLQALDPILPAETVWSYHMLAGLTLFAVSVAYIAYMSQSGLTRRIRPDKARLLGLFGRPQARLGALNIILYWLLFAMLTVLIVTGCLLYTGYGGLPVTIHRFSTWLILAFPVAHVAVHWAMGGVNQLLRVFRATRLMPPPPPFDPFEVLALPDYTKNASIIRGQANDKRKPAPRPRSISVVDEWRRSETILQANPLVVATVAGIAAAAFLLTLDEATRDTLHIPRIPPERAPILDGDISDPVWRSATPVFVETQQGLNFDGKGATTVELRAVHDGETVYFSFIWEDSTRSLKLLPLVKKQDGWYVVQTGFDREDENAYYDDGFSIAFTTTDSPAIRYPGGHTFHIGVRPLPDKPASFVGRGLHYSDSKRILDVWYWRPSHGGMLGWCDDASIGPPAEPTKEQVEGKRRYMGGLGFDPGKGMYELNFEQQAPGGYSQSIRPKRLPRDPRKTLKAMGNMTTDPNKSESDGAVWWLTEADSVPYTREWDAKFPVGTLIPGVLITGEPTGDRADVRCAAKWTAGRWALEASRRLDTHSEHDVVINNKAAFRLAAFDHSEIGHTRQIRAIRVELE